MPKGVEVVVQDGFATVDFVDRSLAGPALANLIEKFGPGIIETNTRSGPRRTYTLPEGNAREAGLLDTASTVEPRITPDTGAADALVAADPVKAGGEWHQPVITVKDNAYVGATPTEEVLGNTSPASTIFGDTAALVIPPSSQDLIEAKRARGNPFVAIEEDEESEAEPESQAAPSLSWKRSELNEAAAELGVESPEKLGNKEEVLDAIEKAREKSKK